MCKPWKTMLVSLNNFCHIHLCANHAVVIWLFPAGKLEQLFWAPKMHMFLRSKVLRGHKRPESAGTSASDTVRLSGLVQQLTLRQISCIVRWCGDSDLCPSLVDWTSGPVRLTLNEDVHSSNWLITNLLLTCFDIFEYSWSFGDRSVFEKFELVRSEFCIFLLQPGQAFVNHSCQNHFSRITSTDRWSYLPFDMVLSAIRLNVAGSPTDWKHSSECKAHKSRAYSPNFWRSNMPCSSALFVWLWLWESSENQQLTLRIYVTHSYRLEIEALFLFNVFFPMYPADGAKLLVQHSNCVWCRKRRCIDACFVGLGHQPHVLLRRDPTEGARWEGQVWKEHAGRTILCNLFLNIFWSFCSLNF